VSCSTVRRLEQGQAVGYCHTWSPIRCIDGREDQGDQIIGQRYNWRHVVWRRTVHNWWNGWV